MKKLLIIGCDTTTKDVIDYCSNKNIYSILVDNSPAEKNPLKMLTNDHWEIDVVNIEELERRSLKENIDGIFSGCSELCINSAIELSKRLNFPFYIPDKAWKATKDKEYFKEECIKAGLDVPKKISISKGFDKKVLEDIQFPIIIKPIDSSASRGVKKCDSIDDFEQSLEYALSFSPSKQVIIEEFIEGQMSVAYLYIVDGVVHLVATTDALKNDDGKIVPFSRKQSLVGLSYSRRQIKFFEQHYMDKFDKLFSNLDCSFGYAAIQTIQKNGKCYCFEMNYRLDGAGEWHVTNDIFGLNPLNNAIDYCLDEKVDGHLLPKVMYDETHQSINYLVLSKPGIVGKVNCEETRKIPGVYVVFARFKSGDVVKDEPNLFSFAYHITVVANSKQELVNKVIKINETLVQKDTNGNNMLEYFDSYDVLLSSLD